MNIEDTYELVMEKLVSWQEAFVVMLPNLVVAVLILLLAYFTARIAEAVSKKLMGKLTDSKTITDLVGTVVRIGIVVVGLFFALGVLQLQKTVTSLLAGAGIVGLAMGFAFQDLAANFIAGFLMGIRQPFRVGDIIKTNGFMGRVKKLNLRNTLVETFEGQMVIIPNKEVFENPLENFSYTGHRRITLGVGVAYDTDLEEASRVATEALESLDFRNKDRGVGVYALEFGDSSINFSLRFWIDYPGDTDYFAACHAGVLAVFKAFNEHGIEIPFPIRTLDLPDGVLGADGGQNNSSDTHKNEEKNKGD